MGIYLPNMEMPTKGYRLILVHADGTVQTTDGETTAVPVPPHGDLIDQKELMKRFCGHCDGYEECSDKSMCSRAEECFDLKLIANTPTVIEAEEGEG